MKLLLTALITALIVILAPGSAHAATCGVPQRAAEYETPEVQIFQRGSRLYACHRASGRQRIVGLRYTDGMGTYGEAAARSVLGGRYTWTFSSGWGAESLGEDEEVIHDLVTGQRVGVLTRSEYAPTAQAAAFAGGFVSAGEDGVIVRFADGRRVSLSLDSKAHRPAVAGGRAYWSDADGVAHTATFELPAAEKPGTPARARTIGRCRPRPAARLLLHAGRIVVTRAGGGTWACARGRTRRVVPGPAGEVRVLDGRRLAYTRPGFAGVLDVCTGARSEQPSAGGPLVVGERGQLLTSSAAGVLSRGRLLSPEPGGELAVNAEAGVVYWLDPAGAPRTAAL